MDPCALKDEDSFPILAGNFIKDTTIEDERWEMAKGYIALQMNKVTVSPPSSRAPSEEDEDMPLIAESPVPFTPETTSDSERCICGNCSDEEEYYFESDPDDITYRPSGRRNNNRGIKRKAPIDLNVLGPREGALEILKTYAKGEENAKTVGKLWQEGKDIWYNLCCSTQPKTSTQGNRSEKNRFNSTLTGARKYKVDWLHAKTVQLNSDQCEEIGTQFASKWVFWTE
jgi:hypothetical protein